MIPISKTWHIIFGALVASAVSSVFYHNSSYDMGLHYSLITHLYDGDCVQTEFMCQYPPASHAVAALIGKLVHSPFLGMVLLSSLAVFVLYSSTLSLMRLPDASATAIGYLFFSIICILGSARRLPLFGNEIRDNFFFGQLVGTAAMFAFVVLHQQLKPAIAILAVFVLGWFYPISSVQLAGATIVSLLLQRRSPLHIAVTAVLLASAIRLHPLFQNSVTLASNEGAIGTGRIPASWTIPFAFALIVACAPLARLRTSMPFVSLAFGVAGAAIAQWLGLMLLHMGSNYIVSKHIFGIMTMLTAAISLNVARHVSSVKLRLVPWAVPACALICTVLVLPPHGSSTSDFIKAETESEETGPNNPLDQFALDVGPRKISIAEALAKRLPK